jgi:hypothetical protein
MPRLLVVHHTPSPALQEMFEAAVSGARTDEIEDVEVVIRPALTAAAVDILEADGYQLGTPVQQSLGTLRRSSTHRRGLDTYIVHCEQGVSPRSLASSPTKPALQASMAPCCTPLPLAPLAWWIQLPRSVVATGVARIHLERIIHRGNFRMAEWAGRLLSRRGPMVPARCTGRARSEDLRDRL